MNLAKFSQGPLAPFAEKTNYAHPPIFFFTHYSIFFYTILDCKDCSIFYVCTDSTSNDSHNNDRDCSDSDNSDSIDSERTYSDSIDGVSFESDRSVSYKHLQ